MAKNDFDLLGFKFHGKYFFDKIMPFGSSISCAIWEKFATELHWIIQSSSRNPHILHYLDGYSSRDHPILIGANLPSTFLKISVAISEYQ